MDEGLQKTGFLCQKRLTDGTIVLDDSHELNPTIEVAGAFQIVEKGRNQHFCDLRVIHSSADL